MKLLAVLALGMLNVLINAVIGMVCWNVFVVAVFKLPSITLLQAYAAFVLVNALKGTTRVTISK